MGILKQILHGLLANPTVYDISQYLVGVSVLHRKLETILTELIKTNSRILDIGGGTGLLKKVCNSNNTYLCLDVDDKKLQGFRSKFSDGIAIMADGTKLPLPDESLDIILCIFLTHHLNEDNLEELMSECGRVIRSTGSLVLLDPILNENRPTGLLLWKFDQGSFPRKEYILTEYVQSRFKIGYYEKITILHDYSLFVAQKSL